MALDANFQGSPEHLSNTPVINSDVFSESRLNNTLSTTYGRSDTASPLFASADAGTGTNNNLFPSAESLLGADLNFGQGTPVRDTPPPSGDTQPRRSESPITDQAIRELAQRFGISPEVLQSVKQLAEQFGFGQHFTPENVQKFLEVAQRHNLTQYMTPENLQTARQYADSMIQQHGGIGQIVSLARENPQAALNMITSMLPQQIRGQATAFVQGLMERFRPNPNPRPQ